MVLDFNNTKLRKAMEQCVQNILGVQSLSCVWLCNPMDAHQASLSFTSSQSLLKLTSTE